jgi:hypothetical protein
MTAIAANASTFLRLLPRAVLLLTLLAGPVLAVPTVLHAGTSPTIDAPAPVKKGIGFVLLVSLRRG